MPSMEIHPGEVLGAAIAGECARVVTAFSYLRPLLYEAASSAHVAARMPVPWYDGGPSWPFECDLEELDLLMSELEASLGGRATHWGEGLEAAIDTARAISSRGLEQGLEATKARQRIRSALAEVNSLAAAGSPVRSRESAMYATLQRDLASRVPAWAQSPTQVELAPPVPRHCPAVCREAIRLHMAYTSRLGAALRAALEALGE